MNDRLVLTSTMILLNLATIFYLCFSLGNSRVQEVGTIASPSVAANTAIDEVDYYYQMAKRHGTDKVTEHAYQHLYGLYLGPLRSKSITLIEIGLGCNMMYGPGKSLGLWREYTPNAKVHVLEYDAPCARKYESQMDKVYTGDQSDLKLLKEIASNNKYDVIIDDGGHSRKQQINSLVGLWPALKPKGVYIIEDMFTTLMSLPIYNDLNISTVQLMTYFTHRFNGIKLPLPVYETEMDLIYSTLLSVNCFREACVLIKT